MAIELDPKQMLRILHSESGHNSIFDLEVQGHPCKTKVMIVDWQYEPIKGTPASTSISSASPWTR